LRGQDSGPFSRLSQASARELDDLKTVPEHAKKWRAVVAQTSHGEVQVKG
jgi:hypothetical protein